MMPKYKCFVTTTRVLGTWVNVDAENEVDATLAAAERAMEDDNWQTIESQGWEVCETREVK
jgi:hypothetical protein